MKSNTRVIYFAPRTWAGWVVTIVVGLLLLAVAAVFVTAALVAGLAIASVLMARVWWLMRKAGRKREKEYLSAEYEVEREEIGRLRDSGADEDARRRR